MIKAIFLLFSVCLAFLSFTQEEKINLFSSDIVIGEDRIVTVTGTIVVYSRGIDIKRGIFREIPLSYEYNGGNYRVDFDLISVKRDGKVEKFQTESVSNGIRIYCGDKDVFLETGQYTYEIEYQVEHVLGFYEKYDEFYWNVNGNGWIFNIDSISAVVHYPKGAKLVQLNGYTGRQGEKSKDFSTIKSQNSVVFSSNKPMQAHEGLSVAVAWEKGHIIYPTPSEEFWFWLQTYLLYIICVLGLIISFLFNFILWWKHGRDPKKGTIIPLFKAPDDFSPAECAYLENEGRRTNTMFGSTLISLATKGYLSIEKEKKGLIFKHNKYTITKTKGGNIKPINDIEKAFKKQLFSMNDIVEIEKGVYNSKINVVSNNLVNDIDDKQNKVYFQRNSHLRVKPFIITFILLVFGAVTFALYGGAIFILIVSVILSVIINLIFYRLLEQPTQKGRQKMDEIAGFKMYMKYTDKERIKLMNPPTLDFSHFEENLAYAIALDIAEEWAGKFEPKELRKNSSLFMPYLIGTSFHDIGDMGNELASTISSASTPPSSSSGGSSGGGFSGGGFGGGGGGGW